MGAFGILGMSTPLPSAGICAMMHVLLTLFGRRFLEGAKKKMRKLMKAKKLKKPSPRKKKKERGTILYFNF
jgi:hypothetical protein